MTGISAISSPTGVQCGAVVSQPDGTTPIGVLAAEAQRCRACAEHPRGAGLPHAPRPIFRVSSSARIVIASQAPGAVAHASGIPFNDASGVRLRDWMGLTPERFHDPDRVCIVPMGFCFPGYDPQGGDRPPRPECRDLWHDRMFAAMPQVELILMIGLHAMRYHMARRGIAMGRQAGMAAIVADWRSLEGTWPRLIPLPHPSWRNTAWLNHNPWFATELLPVLRAAVARLAG